LNTSPAIGGALSFLLHKTLARPSLVSYTKGIPTSNAESTMKVLQYILSLKPALPMSKEKPCTEASNSEIRRWCRDKSVIINGKQVVADEELDWPVESLVFFPKSNKNRCTLV
jgi:hypothetical protein